MPDWIVKYWGQWLFGLIGAGLTAAIAYFRHRFKRMDRLEARIAGVEVALRA